MCCRVPCCRQRGTRQHMSTFAKRIGCRCRHDTSIAGSLVGVSAHVSAHTHQPGNPTRSGRPTSARASCQPSDGSWIGARARVSPRPTLPPACARIIWSSVAPWEVRQQVALGSRVAPPSLCMMPRPRKLVAQGISRAHRARFASRARIRYNGQALPAFRPLTLPRLASGTRPAADLDSRPTLARSIRKGNAP